MKKVVRAIITLVVIFCIIIPAYAKNKMYTRLTVIVDTEQADTEWLIYCQDKQGNIWTFYDDIDEWKQGDICNLLMIRIDEQEEHDEIINVCWEGYIESIESFLSLIGWR